MSTKPQHPTKTVYDCPEDERIRRIELLQDGQFKMIKELGKDIRDALFPSDLHPDNGLINQMKNMKENFKAQTKDISALRDTVEDLTSAVTDLRTSISGINRFMEDVVKFKVETETAAEIKLRTEDILQKQKDRSQARTQWIIYISIGIITALLTYILSKPN